MSDFVLVHGAWAGGWSWEKVVPLLGQKGHQVKAPDLPGHGMDKTPLSGVNLQAYTEKICQVLDEFDDQVILVGHSMGGIVISQAAEERPQKVKKLVYLAAYLLQNGETIMQVFEEDKGSLLGANLTMPDDKSYVTLNEEGIKEVVYPDASDEDKAQIMERIVSQASMPFATPINITEENYGSISRVYIECLNDLVITPTAQKDMYTKMPCERVLSLNASHTPNYGAPEKLVEQLLNC